MVSLTAGKGEHRFDMLGVGTVTLGMEEALGGKATCLGRTRRPTSP